MRTTAVALALVTALALGACGGKTAQQKVTEASAATDIETHVQANFDESDTASYGFTVSVNCTRINDERMECIGTATADVGTITRRYVVDVAQDGSIVWHSEGDAITDENPDYVDPSYTDPYS